MGKGFGKGIVDDWVGIGGVGGWFVRVELVGEVVIMWEEVWRFDFKV